MGLYHGICHTTVDVASLVLPLLTLQPFSLYASGGSGLLQNLTCRLTTRKAYQRARSGESHIKLFIRSINGDLDTGPLIQHRLVYRQPQGPPTLSC
jgi:hypothetical protein